MAAWPALKEVRSLLRLQPDPDQDALIATALAAAIDYGQGRTGLISDGLDPPGWTPKYPGDTTVLPDSAHQACLVHAAKLFRRRDSIDGTLGFGDMGAIRVGRFDADIDALYARTAPLVFG